MLQNQEIIYTDSKEKEFMETLDEDTKLGFSRLKEMLIDMEKNNAIGYLVGLIVRDSNPEAKERVLVFLIQNCEPFFKNSMTKKALPLYLKGLKKEIESEDSKKVLASFIGSEATMSKYNPEAEAFVKGFKLSEVTKKVIENMQDHLLYKIDTYTLFFETLEKSNFVEAKHIIWDTDQEESYVMSPNPVASSFVIHEEGKDSSRESRFSIFN